MSRESLELPERLRAGGGSDLERRLLDAMAHEQTPPEVRDHVAHGLGVSLTGLGLAAGGTAPSTGAPATGAAAGAGTGSTSLLPWISAGLLGLAVAGGIVGTLAWKTSNRQPPALPPAMVSSSPAARAAAVPAPIPPAPMQAVPAANLEPQPGASAARPIHPFRAATPATALRDQTSLVDAARAAVSSGAANRAIELVRQYEGKYPTGNFRPEATAIKIEALAKLGRTAETRALAERFVAEYGRGPLSERVARIAGIAQP
jgi:hypothetical protein